MTRLMTLALIATLLIMPGCKKEEGGSDTTPPKTGDTGTDKTGGDSADKPNGDAADKGDTKPAADVKEVTIESNDMMKFNLNAFEVKPGQKVKLTLKNVGKLPKAAMGHNWVLLKKGIGAVTFGSTVASGKGGASLATDWIPTQDPQKGQMIAHTKLLGPGESDTIEFTAPTEPGAYEYLCMFPGHFALMKGIMTVK